MMSEVKESDISQEDMAKIDANKSYNELNIDSGPSGEEIDVMDSLEDKYIADNQWLDNKSVCNQSSGELNSGFFESVTQVIGIERREQNMMTDSKVSLNRWVQPVMASPLDPIQVLSNLYEFCGNYFKCNKKAKTEMSVQFSKYLRQILPELCQQLNSLVLDKEPNVISISSLCYVFGDIHGNLQDLYDMENMFWRVDDKTTNYLFLGDYVDRGPNSVEVCVYLFALKLSEPNRFHLVRGNHEVRLVNKGYTFFTECIQKFGKDFGNQIWDQINSCFERLPLAAIIDNVIFCCHGGVPKSETVLQDLRQCVKPLVNPEVECPTAHQLLWNDPIESMTTYKKDTERNLKQKKVEFVFNRSRSTGYYFTALAAKRFLDSSSFTHMIRAHESVEKGYKFTSKDRVITVFSSSHYSGMNNTTACAEVSTSKVKILILKVGDQHNNSSVD